MKVIRSGVFETNSSSCHSIAIGDSLPEDLKIPKRLEVCELELGRNFDYNTVEQRFTVAVMFAYYDSKQTLEKLLKMLNNIGVQEFILAKCKGYSLLFNGAGIEIGNISEASDDADIYIKEIMKSEDTLKKWIFSNDSYLYGEDDNEW